MHAFYLPPSSFLPPNLPFPTSSSSSRKFIGNRNPSCLGLGLSSSSSSPSRKFIRRKNPSSMDLGLSSSSSSSSSVSVKSCNSVVSGKPLTVAEKVNRLATEFESLTEPIDRVKRLLEYASLLPPYDEASKVGENRVTGCATQVWLKAEMVDDDNGGGGGVMRFGVDSDSEITRGFCSCLIWLLDGEAPEDVLSVKIDDLFHMNVGFPSRGHSRVNTWHNVLFDMQRKTKDLVEEKGRKSPSLEELLLIGYNDVGSTTGRTRCLTE